MPEASGILRTDGVAFIVEQVGDYEDFRMARQAAFLAHMLFKDAKTLGEGNLLGRGDFLVTKKNDFVVKKGLGNLRESVVAQRLCQIYPGNFCADVFANSGYGNHENLQ